MLRTLELGVIGTRGGTVLARDYQLAYWSSTDETGADVSNIVYKIVEEREWREAQRSGEYAGSADDRRDGFIHLSLLEQVEGTATRHFRNRADLLLIAFSSETLGTSLRFEPSRDGALFPHLYANLQAKHALWEMPMTVCDDGVPRALGETD